MVVRNDTERVLVIGGGVSGVRLMPGLNILSDGAWGMMCNTPFVQALIERGKLKEVPSERAAPEEQGAPPADRTTEEARQAAELAAMSVKSAVSVVRELDNQLLLRWLVEHETRKQVQSAAQRRLDDIEEQLRKRIEEHDQ